MENKSILAQLLADQPERTAPGSYLDPTMWGRLNLDSPVTHGLAGALRGLYGMVDFPRQYMQGGIDREAAVDWAAPMALNMVGAPSGAGGLGSGARRGIKGPMSNSEPLKVWRGGSTPLSRDEIPEAYPGQYEFYAHTDPGMAAEYGKTSFFHVDPTGYLDARTPEGLKLWQTIGRYPGDFDAIRKAGYKGAIYPDPHDWGFAAPGHEVVVFDPASARLRLDD